MAIHIFLIFFEAKNHAFVHSAEKGVQIMKHLYNIILFSISLLVCQTVAAKPAELSQQNVTDKMHEIMRAHVLYKHFSPLLAKRSISNFIEALDPTKTYFLFSEIERWLDLDEDGLKQVVEDFEQSEFPLFTAIFEQMDQALKRRDLFEERLKGVALPKNVTPKEFKDMSWCANEAELYNRLKRLRALQLEAAGNIGDDATLRAKQRLAKKRKIMEEEFQNTDPVLRQETICTHIMKALASSLDPHTMYFTPDEASQFLFLIQQRLVGIGVQLRDDVDGFTIVKMVEGGPAEVSKEIKVKDKIIGINGEPVIGLDDAEVIDMIRGPSGTQVALRVIREIGHDGAKMQQVKEIHLTRGDVIVKEARLETAIEPFGEGVIAHLHLHSFYQDEDSSSTTDIIKALGEIRKNYKVVGVMLDLRNNSGGILTEAVNIVGLFIKKGVVVSIKDEQGSVHHMRDLDSEQIWDGPVAVLVNRLSASAAEIVAQALQDYGRALIIGDDHTYGKGTFQTFTLTGATINPEGEYKVTRGCYYTVSGKTPQLVGTRADIMIPSGLMGLEIGEEYAKYPIENDTIAPSFNDTFSDISFFQRDRVRRLYGNNVQKPDPHIRSFFALLRKNSKIRQENNKAYQRFLLEMKKSVDEMESDTSLEHAPDFQLQEAMNTMKDYIIDVVCNFPAENVHTTSIK